MVRRARGLWIVESVSLFRLLSALLFTSLAFQGVPLWLVAALYGAAMCSDLIDGLLARRLNAASYFGKVLDLISDKVLTIVSVMYAVARGVDLVPLALIATREVIMIGFRMVTVQGKQIFPTSRSFGAVMAILLWGTTLFLVLGGEQPRFFRIANTSYWGCSIVYSLNLLYRVYVSFHRIRASLEQDV